MTENLQYEVGLPEPECCLDILKGPVSLRVTPRQFRQTDTCVNSLSATKPISASANIAPAAFPPRVPATLCGTSVADIEV